MQRLTPAVVAYGLLVALAAEEVHIKPQPACNVEEFGVEGRCHDCVIFHTQMLQDGVNLTTRCAWPPDGSDLRPPSEFAHRSFSVGKRPICESCNDFYHRLLGGSPSFNLTENCGWQIAAPTLDELSPPVTTSPDIVQHSLDGSPPFSFSDKSGRHSTALILDESPPPPTASFTYNGTCISFTVCCVLLVPSTAAIVIYCCLMRSKCTRKTRLGQRCLACGCTVPKENFTDIVVSHPNGNTKLDVPVDADNTLLLKDNDRNTHQSTRQSHGNGTSSNPTTFSNSSSQQKKYLRNRRKNYSIASAHMVSPRGANTKNLEESQHKIAF